MIGPGPRIGLTVGAHESCRCSDNEYNVFFRDLQGVPDPQRRRTRRMCIVEESGPSPLDRDAYGRGQCMTDVADKSERLACTYHRASRGVY